ncbi:MULTISPECIES: ATP-binding protein [unclassified Streptomyces]|uniref:ATP-binding protein n=1 Tax=unclassified Streptomyces TaxID=2593676 RepID=UPI000DAF3F1A|nr:MULTISPECIES: ATP-binding protein [unclassified Streptomyces]PZT75882.1 ATP-binding protein [Streptomyces sp. AC1-42W]PZT80165.1 ATP-binding protein [Streptomyces sp. AC1-42T]
MTAVQQTPAGLDGPDAAVAELWARLGEVERRVRIAVALRREVDPEPDDPFLGQYLTPAAAERVLDSRDAFRPVPGYGPQDPGPSPEGGRIGALVARFGLAGPDVDLLLVAMAPDIDARFERLYGYLNDDLTRRRATIGLALELCGLPGAGPGRFRFSPSAPLVAAGLVEILEPERPLLSRVLRVPDRVTAHLLGDDEVDARAHGLVRVAAPPDGPDGPGGCPVTRRVAAAAGTGSGLVHLLDRGGDPARLAAGALAAAGLRPLVVDAAALAAASEPDLAVRVLATEARLSGAGLVLGPLETLAPERPKGAALLGALCAAAGGGAPLLLYGKKNWDPLWAAESPVTIPVAPADPADAIRRWRGALADAGAGMGMGAGVGAGADDGTAVGTGSAGDDAELVDAIRAYRLDSAQIRRAATVASRLAALEGRPVAAGDLRTAVRAQNGAGLARLARRIEPAVGWDDLVLPPATRRQLSDLALRARHRDQVLGRWRMRPGGGRGRGIVALFAGESGTGKTMSAEVIAADLGMELYVVDLSSVVDKYVGETEKNLERIFTEASDVNAVLLFDEADAVFGKRSQVKDAQDRHANVESAYLLQRIESFDGIAVLTTNLRANLDEAFTRRLDVVADFPVPNAEQRLALWERCLGTEIPRAPDLDLPTCAERFELTGGSIRACAVTAAYQAADSGRPLDTDQLVTAVLAEYRKLGRLVLDSEFGPWLRRTRNPGSGGR